MTIAEEHRELDRLSHQYIKRSLFILVGLTLLALAYMSVRQSTTLLRPIVVSLLYNFTIGIVYTYAWRTVRKYSPDSRLNLFIYGGMIRLITAIAVLGIMAIIIEETNARIEFAIVFCVYYFAMRFFDTTFFLKTEKTQTVKNENNK